MQYTEHPSNIIAKAIQAKLKSSTDAGDEVYLGVEFPAVDESSTTGGLPALLVRAGSEDIQGQKPQGTWTRILTLEVESLASADDAADLENALARLALQVERIVLADNRLKDDSGWAWARDINPAGLSKQYGETTEGGRLVCWQTQSFNIEYAFDEEAEPGSLDDFLHFHGQYVLQPDVHPDESHGPDAEDDVMLPQD